MSIHISRILGLILIARVLGIAPARLAAAQPKALQLNWVATWASAQRIPEPQSLLAPNDLHDATLRQIVHLSTGGSILRVRLSNAFGAAPLRFTSVHIAKALYTNSPRIDPATDRAVTFSGSPEVTVPAGADYTSDPVNLSMAALSSLAITFHLDNPPDQQTGHPGSRATSYLCRGNLVSAADLPDARQVDHWYQISGVDVVAPRDAASIVFLGDSITDGPAATMNGNDRFTDIIAERLQALHIKPERGVLNEGINGNRLLTDGVGSNALARFDRDVLAQAGVRYLVILEGINDLSGLMQNGDVARAKHADYVQRILSSYEQIVMRAHAQGIKVMGATLLPFIWDNSLPRLISTEADRQEINKWIRTPGHFDAIVDFDKAVRDPIHPEQMLPPYDSGDHLHPSPEGNRELAKTISLSFFVN